MYSYCFNDPVNMEDISGYWAWLNKLYNKVVNWFNTVPTSAATVPTANTVITNASSAILGGSLATVESQKKNTPFYGENGTVKVAPMGKYEVNKFPKTAAIVSKASTVLTVATGSLDVANTWTANNNNTNGQRCLKMGIQLAGVAAGYGLGVLTLSVLAPMGLGVVTFGIAVTGVAFVGATIISETQNKIYKWTGID